VPDSQEHRDPHSNRTDTLDPADGARDIGGIDAATGLMMTSLTRPPTTMWRIRKVDEVAVSYQQCSVRRRATNPPPDVTRVSGSPRSR